MRFLTTSLAGVWLIQLEPHQDERGFLARTYCEREFAERGLNTRWPQCNTTFTRQRGMIRGLHYQADPKPETKLIRCTAGVVFDVLVDVRPGSPTYGRWASFELSSHNHCQLYAPGGLAHGFQCLSDNCELFYLMSESYFPELARGIRWNDPTLNIPWPLAHPILSARDQNLPLLPTCP
jgi:dTDP-4-dehydrorhamnose 3,5-epimerase